MSCAGWRRSRAGCSVRSDSRTPRENERSMTAVTEPLTIDVPGSGTVSALRTLPAGAHAGFVLAHGAGAGMHHAFMAAVSDGLGRRGVATLRFQFPSMERASRRPDPPRVAHAAVRAAVG